MEEEKERKQADQIDIDGNDLTSSNQTIVFDKEREKGSVCVCDEGKKP